MNEIKESIEREGLSVREASEMAGLGRTRIQSVQSYRIVCPEIKSRPPRRTLRVDRGSCFPGMSGRENGVLAGALDR
jgi:hypothetical protein